jgi:ubiquinone/menaquinone biosynthesis C-methylase UbiE
VGHVKHSDAQCRAQIAEWWSKLSRHFTLRLKDYDRRILDFGCGVGRFTPLLAGIPGKEVIGVDVSPSMVEMARRASPALDFRVVNPRRLPFPDGYFDALWTCTVLQHIPDAELPHVVKELRRVLKPDAVVLLFENTNQHGKRTSGSGHVVFRRDTEYRVLFPGIGSAEAWPVEKEAHTVITGRLAPGQ